MKDFLRVLRRFVPPYKKYMVWNILFNILSALLNLCSFALIIPILNILFKISTETYAYMDWTFAPFSLEAWKATPELLKNNFFWFVSDLIETRGGPFTLIVLGLFLILSTFLKVGTMCLAFFTMIPIRTGVVRDIRNQINRKITELPLGFFSEERKGDIIARVSGDVNEIETLFLAGIQKGREIVGRIPTVNDIESELSNYEAMTEWQVIEMEGVSQRTKVVSFSME